ncbi:MAG: hypothetical protein ACLFRD_11945 [Nitriliruptoraceae bacterium]
MPIRAVTAAGAAAALLAAVLAVVHAGQAGGWLAAVAVAVGALGIGALLGVVIVLLRDVHRQLRALRSDAKERDARLKHLERDLAALTDDDGELARLRAGLVDDLDVRHDQLLGTLDARVLAIQAALRELAGVEDERPDQPGQADHPEQR